MKFRFKSVLGVGVALAAMAATSKAESVTAKLTGVYGGSGTITVNGVSEGAGIGALLWTTNTTGGGWTPTAEPTATPDFWTFCIQATYGHNIFTGSTYTFTMGTLETTADLGFNLPSGTAAAKAAAIQHMFNYVNVNVGNVSDPSSISGTGKLTADQAAGLQLAIWEIVYDGVTGSLNKIDGGGADAGEFKVSGETSGARTAALLYLSHDQDPGSMVLSGLAGPSQDQGIGLPPLANPVPLPGTAVATMALLGLNGAGLWYGKRRRAIA